jgi:phage terminase large subunit-like protein
MRGREWEGVHELGIKGKDLYLLDVLRRRMEYPELKRAVREQYERYRPSVVLIEDKASGTQLFSGIHRAVAADGTVEMTESDAAPLLRAGWVRIKG